MAAPFEIAAQLAVVVDLPVEDDPDRTVLVADRLLPVLKVDDAQPTHSEPDPVAEIDAFIVGTAVDHRAAHGAHLVLDHGTAVPPDDACDATHDWVYSR